MSSTSGPASAEQASAFGKFMDPSIVQQGVAAALQAHVFLLTSMEAVADHWIRGRREALNDTQRLIERLPSCRTIVEVVQVQHEWMRGVGQRLVLDVSGPLGTAVLSPIAATPSSSVTGAPLEEATPVRTPERDTRAPLPMRTAAGTSEAESKIGQRQVDVA